MLLEQETPVVDVELDTILNVVNWVFARVTGFINICNQHHSLWLPVGFAIAGMTVFIFKSALNVPTNRNF